MMKPLEMKKRKTPHSPGRMTSWLHAQVAGRHRLDAVLDGDGEGGDAAHGVEELQPLLRAGAGAGRRRRFLRGSGDRAVDRSVGDLGHVHRG